MLNALREAQLQPQDIHYINAHGTATLAATSKRPRPSGRCSVRCGQGSGQLDQIHAWPPDGATGAVEFMAAVLALQNQAIRHHHLHEPDRMRSGLRAQPSRSGVKLDAVMSNSFAFGGSNAVLIAKHFKA